ncbi:hypothetical protein KUCAC02_003739 [Chaenocephalus aceratus]|uniref:Uncharacterized protein n=1 Tax=Chaenocephalus aceratus TaxID=36190 RepID=A0ACB9WNC9_CHAAC|nr:hypothetical protein KUCAC02_003739 [Chaenocephalus aceratus]
MCVVRVEGGYDTHDQACILPTAKAPNCSCKGKNFTVVPGKPVILIIINGRYDLHLPLYVCQTCQQQWTPDLKVLLKSGYWPASVSISTLYTLDLLSSFEELKVISPGFSRQAFAKLLEHLTKCGGRSGPVNGDALQRSFLEFSYASYAEDQLCCGAPFICTPEMLAVSADGNGKLYRFWRSGSSDGSVFFNGLFVAEDSAVAAFTQGRGTCGDSQWTAARETSRGASKLDEEGMEVAELMPAKAKFFAMDVACKYWPYMEKAATTFYHQIIWSGKNQEGAGMTAGEEVEQVNSYLSRCALTKQEWASGTSSTSEDILQTALQQSIEGLYLSVRQRKQSLYRQNDSSKLRHRLRRKLADDKKHLNQEILK